MLIAKEIAAEITRRILSESGILWRNVKRNERKSTWAKTLNVIVEFTARLFEPGVRSG
jgi:hypothetical protein